MKKLKKKKYCIWVRYRRKSSIGESSEGTLNFGRLEVKRLIVEKS